jgi:putative ABC transport system ATP-binding protein
MQILEASGLRKQYDLGAHKVAALGGVDFVVTKGEFVSIMGPSGSGKSTLLHLLGGLDRPSGGEITLAGQQLSVLNDDQVTLVRRHNIGFIFQFFNLLPTLTAEENVALPLIIDGQDPRKYQQRMDELLALVGLADRRGHKPEQLSGGEQQRVSIARALVTNPAIVLADEPTGNLDSKNGALIMDLLRRTCTDFGQTTIMVTHDSKAAAYADRVVFLKDGQIVKELSLKTLPDMGHRLRAVVEIIEDLQTPAEPGGGEQRTPGNGTAPAAGVGPSSAVGGTLASVPLDGGNSKTSSLLSSLTAAPRPAPVPATTSEPATVRQARDLAKQAGGLMAAGAAAAGGLVQRGTTALASTTTVIPARAPSPAPVQAEPLRRARTPLTIWGGAALLAVVILAIVAMAAAGIGRLAGVQNPLSLFGQGAQPPATVPAVALADTSPTPAAVAAVTATPAAAATGQATSVPPATAAAQPAATSAATEVATQAPTATATAVPSATPTAEAPTAVPPTPVPPTAVPPTEAPTPVPASPTPIPATARPAPTAPPALPAASAPSSLSPANGSSVSGGVVFQWQPTAPLPAGTGYEVVWWKPSEDPAGARGIAPPTTATSLSADLTPLYDSGQMSSDGQFYWTVLVVQTNPYVRLTQPGASSQQLLSYGAGGGGAAPNPPKPR